MENTTPDNALVQRARDGDTAAFGLLVARHEAGVRGIIRGMVDEAEADDLAQDVFIKLFKSLGRFQGDAALSTYLGRIAINTALDAIKQRKRRRLSFWVSTDDDQPRQLPDSSQSPERADLQDALRLALARLTPDYRSVVVLRLVEGYSVAETAQMLGIPNGTVASRLSRAQHELKTYLQPILQP